MNGIVIECEGVGPIFRVNLPHPIKLEDGDVLTISIPPVIENKGTGPVSVTRPGSRRSGHMIVVSWDSPPEPEADLPTIVNVEPKG